MASFKLIFGKMSAQYESLLESGNLSDVVLVAGDKELHVHKLVLSTRSAFFSAMFANPTKEAQENRVEMIDVDAEVLELMVRYLYTGKVDMLDRYASDLLVIADMYQVASLKLICEEQLLSEVITTESVSELLLFADMYHATELTAKCLNYITLNATQVMATEGWRKIRVKPEWLEKIIAHSSLKYSEAIWNRKFIELHNTTPFAMASFNLLIFEEMSDNYESLRKSCIRSDVVLLVGEKELKVHRLVLSTRSSFFAAMFTNYHSTTKEICLKVTNVDFEVLQWWVRYIYTGKVDMLEQYAKELFVLAVEFRVDCLKFICKLELLSQITIESVCELLLLADFYQVAELSRQCLDYIATNITQVMRQHDDNWMRIVLEPNLLTQIYQQHLLLNFSELQLLSKISSEPATFLFSADMFSLVSKLSDECLEYIVDNITQVMASEGWKDFLKGTDLLPQLYEYLHWKYLKLSNVDLEKKKKASGIDLTIRSDLKFEKYLLKNSNVIDYKEERSDVILVAGNKELKVHKQVLSAESPVFASMIRAKNRVLITDVDVKVLKLLLKYIYTGKVKLLDRDVVELMVAAEKYQLVSLISKCEQKLLSNWRLVVIRTKTVSDLLIFADMHLVAELYLKCLDYIAHHLTRVMASDGWKRIVLKVDLLTNICGRLNLNFSEQLLLSPISSDSVLNLLILAEEHQAMELVTKCVEYITDNVTQMMQQVEWEKIVARDDLLAMLFEHLCSKYIRKYTQVLDKERCGRYMRYERKMQEYMSFDISDSEIEYDNNSDYEYVNNFDVYYSYYEYDNDDSYYDFDYEYDNNLLI